MTKRVMILDNDPAVLDVMQEALLYEGFEVKTYEQTDDIFLLINEYKPDILLLDFILNGISGGEICQQIKDNKQTNKSASHSNCVSLSACTAITIRLSLQRLYSQAI